MLSALLAAAALLAVAAASAYRLQDDYSVGGFYNNFDFITGADPTQGSVLYVDQATARSNGLLRSDQGIASWGVDSTTPNAAMRSSVRLQSKKTYSGGLFVPRRRPHARGLRDVARFLDHASRRLARQVSPPRISLASSRAAANPCALSAVRLTSSKASTTKWATR